MLIIVDVECVLVNVLQRQKQINVCDLNKLKTSIEHQVNSVYVDINKECLIWCANYYPNMFSFKENTVYRLKEWSSHYADEFFNWRIPQNVRDKILNIMSVFCQSLSQIKPLNKHND